MIMGELGYGFQINFRTSSSQIGWEMLSITVLKVPRAMQMVLSNTLQF
jgi:hypothetical protein